MNHGEGRVGTVSRLTLQRIGLTTLSPLPQPSFGTIFAIELTTEKQFFFLFLFDSETLQSFSSEA